MGDVIRLRPAPDRPEPSELLWRERVGESLRTERRTAGLRLVDVAGRAGVSPQYLSEVERGLKDPSSELLAAISGALDLDVVELASRAIGVGRGSSGSTPGTGPLCLAA